MVKAVSISPRAGSELFTTQGSLSQLGVFHSEGSAWHVVGAQLMLVGWVDAGEARQE